VAYKCFFFGGLLEHGPLDEPTELIRLWEPQFLSLKVEYFLFFSFSCFFDFLGFLGVNFIVFCCFRVFHNFSLFFVFLNF